MPDGCMDLLWCAGRLVVAGPDTAAHFAAWSADGPVVGLRLPPGMGPAVLGVPARELRDQRVELEDVWPAGEVRRIAEKAGESGPGAVLEALAAERLREAGGVDPVMAAVAGHLARGASVAAVAEATGLDTRRLHRKSTAAFGYGPKTLARILRFTRALEAARAGTAYAEVAATTGYADQAHLSREVRALAGVPLGTLT
ncbi:AraC family transcriptional regulator [Streptomonospora sp. S1-112]|uniref:AraC family transcriptional regulator n=1 Tax=Streptomonospora mangrovi TaxID=2883123 RepID=A0A9X3NMM3_9ACTN|nr:AraC family transcriptional regulator [Streptomonospora mangrovi]MDA0566527.1 AraC family transcriptional regulator [Streptomonospora mangrovi]